MILKAVARLQPRVFVGHEGDAGPEGHPPVHFRIPHVQDLRRRHPEMPDNLVKTSGVGFGFRHVQAAQRQVEKVGKPVVL